MALALGAAGCTPELWEAPEASETPDKSVNDILPVAGSGPGGDLILKDAEGILEIISVPANTINPDSFFANVPEWSDGVIRERFRAARDTRFLYSTAPPDFDPAPTGFVRRLTWLFPEYGCEARAELLSSMAGDVGVEKPYKLFAFPLDPDDKLIFETDYSSNEPGEVRWDWHTMPVVRSSNSGEVYVLDPAIDPTRPLLWDDWLLQMAPSLSQVRITLGDANAYDPSGPQFGGPNKRNQAVELSEGLLLFMEWGGLESLGEDPYDLLGDFPPWQHESFINIEPATGISIYVSACDTCTSDLHALTERCFEQCP